MIQTVFFPPRPQVKLQAGRRRFLLLFCFRPPSFVAREAHGAHAPRFRECVPTLQARARQRAFSSCSLFQTGERCI